jgi:hypothetical protein
MIETLTVKLTNEQREGLEIHIAQPDSSLPAHSSRSQKALSAFVLSVMTGATGTRHHAARRSQRWNYLPCHQSEHARCYQEALFERARMWRVQGVPPSRKKV